MNPIRKTVIGAALVGEGTGEGESEAPGRSGDDGHTHVDLPVAFFS